MVRVPTSKSVQLNFENRRNASLPVVVLTTAVSGSALTIGVYRPWYMVHLVGKLQATTAGEFLVDISFPLLWLF